MTVPVLSSSDPSHGDPDVFTNKNLTFTFAAALDEDTITENTFLLIDQTTSKRVPVTMTYDSTYFRVTMVLSGLLRENTSYRVIIVGNDLRATEVLSGADASDDLVTSIIVEFSTGDDQFHIDTTLGKEVDAKTLEGDLFLPQNVKALGIDFTVDKVRPQNNSAGVAGNITGDKTIRFTFTEALSTTGDVGTWATIETYPLFHTDYLAKSGEIQTLSPSSQDYTLPTGSLSIDDTDLVVTFDRDLPNNLGVTVQLLSAIENYEGLDYGGGLEYTISTELYPDILAPRPIKRELRAIDGEHILDDYIGALLHKNTVFMWELLGRAQDLDDLDWPATKYVWACTILDVLEDQDYEKFLTAGTRRQLGDLNVSVDSLIGRLALKIASTQKDKERALNTLTKGWQFKTAVRSDGVNGLLNLNRLWYDINGRYTNPSHKYDQPDLPASNTTRSRRAKTNNPWF
jgi:hypothetical protein